MPAPMMAIFMVVSSFPRAGRWPPASTGEPAVCTRMVQCLYNVCKPDRRIEEHDPLERTGHEPARPRDRLRLRGRFRAAGRVGPQHGHRRDASTSVRMGVGARFALERPDRSRAAPMEYRITEFEPPSRVVLVGEGSGVWSRDEITFTETAEGTRVDYVAEIRLSGLLGLVQPLLGRAFASIGRNAVAGMKRQLDALAAPPPVHGHHGGHPLRPGWLHERGPARPPRRRPRGHASWAASRAPATCCAGGSGAGPIRPPVLSRAGRRSSPARPQGSGWPRPQTPGAAGCPGRPAGPQRGQAGAARGGTDRVSTGERPLPDRRRRHVVAGERPGGCGADPAPASRASTSSSTTPAPSTRERHGHRRTASRRRSPRWSSVPSCSSPASCRCSRRAATVASSRSSRVACTRQPLPSTTCSPSAGDFERHARLRARQARCHGPHPRVGATARGTAGPRQRHASGLGGYARPRRSRCRASTA